MVALSILAFQQSGYCKYVDKVFTHPAHACPDTDRLVISQLNPGVVCPKRPGHMCKGSILAKYIDDQGGYDLVAYAGDGTNDFCPMTSVMPSCCWICSSIDSFINQD